MGLSTALEGLLTKDRHLNRFECLALLKPMGLQETDKTSPAPDQQGYASSTLRFYALLIHIKKIFRNKCISL
jgi:hypothetical protein